MLRRTALAVAVCATFAATQLPVATIPTADRKDAKDSPLLAPVGVSFASPVAPNRTEDGRAKNRRVELVENSVSAGK